MNISEKVSYIKGLCDGMKINEDKPEGRLFKEIIDVLADIAKEISDLNENSLDLADEIDELSEDLALLEDEIYGDDEEDDEDDDCDCGCHDDPVFFEVKCPSCGNEITIDEDVAALGKIDCPNCGEKLELEFDEDEDEDEDDDCCCCGCEDEDEE
ncbi:MAG: hypothetical protein GX942_00590 [Papillibacter sp.]|jgi:hypothetical protein|nr:hypothetical protein [Papillibacter sp.]